MSYFHYLTLNSEPASNPFSKPSLWWMYLYCAAFAGVTTLYCFAYILFVENRQPATLIAVFECVMKDWLLCLLISPLLAQHTAGRNISTVKGIMQLVAILLFTTGLLGISRIGMELYRGQDTVAHTLFIYTPRYLFISAFIVLAGLLYVHRMRHEAVIENRNKLKPVDQPRPSQDKTLIVNKGNTQVLIRQDDIVSVSASGNYLEIDTNQGGYLLRNTLKEFEQQLDHSEFVRVHRSHIVRLNLIKEVSPSKLEVVLINGKILRIGKTHLNTLLGVARASGGSFDDRHQ